MERFFARDVPRYYQLSIEVREKLVKAPVIDVYFGHQVQKGSILQKPQKHGENPARQKRVQEAHIRAYRLVDCRHCLMHHSVPLFVVYALDGEALVLCEYAVEGLAYDCRRKYEGAQKIVSNESQLHGLSVRTSFAVNRP